MIARPPVSELRPFVSLVWASEGDAVTDEEREIALPTGAMHLVVRTSGMASAMVAADGGVVTLPSAVIGGARDTCYRRIAGSGRSVGAMLRPGAASVLLGAPAVTLAFAHTALDHVWAAGSVAALQDHMATTPDLASALAWFEAALARRAVGFPGEVGIVAAADALDKGASVGTVIERLGWSHRHFVQRFTQEVGLTPRAYRRVRRFDRLVDAIALSPDTPLAEHAANAGYADQAHMSRDFRGFSGLTPGAYRQIAPKSPRHVPLVS